MIVFIEDVSHIDLNCKLENCVWKCTTLNCYALVICLKFDSQYERVIRVDTTDQPVCKSGLLMWLLITEDQLRCFGRHNQHRKATFNSSHVALKSWNVLPQIDLKLMRLSIFKFSTIICVNAWLVQGQKAETVQIYHGHSMDKTSWGKRSFSSWTSDGACNSSIHGCSLCVSGRYARKKRCGLWLTFFATWLRRSSIYEPYKKPLYRTKSCTNLKSYQV